MLSRRQFFRVLAPGDGSETKPRSDARGDRERRRTERYHDLETYATDGAIAGGIPFRPDQQRELRHRVRRLLERECDDDLFSMTMVRRVEELATAFSFGLATAVDSDTNETGLPNPD